MYRVGLISDTHGVLRPQAIAFLRGCDAIVHGGDVGHAHILEQLAALAPVSAVRGNNDSGVWAEALRETQQLDIGGLTVYAIHDLARITIEPLVQRVRVVVSGHSHKPKIETRGRVLYVNPGSAGPRRFSLPIAAGELLVDRDAVTARVVDLLDAVPATLHQMQFML